MKNYKQTLSIEVTPEKVFSALTDPTKIEKWTGSNCKMAAKEGFNFSLWNGSIYGRNLVIIKNKVIVQEWFADNSAWKEHKKDGHTSIVRINLELQDDGTTKLHLLHIDIPEDDFSYVKDGWKKEYLGKIKEMLEYNKL